MPLLKFVHLAAIALWGGALVVLPWLLLSLRVQGTAQDLAAREALHRTARQLVLWFMSPAAFVAVASGTALVFLRPTHLPWFTAKLALVGVMAMLHVGLSSMVLRVFRPNERLNAVLTWGLAAANAAVVLAILTVVLAKPGWSLQGLDAPWLSPGGLRDLVGRWVEPILLRLRG